MAKRFGVMLDMSRDAVMQPAQVKQLASILKGMGYNMIQLYTEDTYEIPEDPYFGYLRGRYSQAELRDIVSYCETIDVEVIPCIQTLAHLDAIFRWAPYAKINDTANILLADEPETYELIERMIRSARSCFKSKYIHIGMDEAHMLGLGKYLDRHGFQNRFEILRRHLEKVISIAKKYDFQPIMWSDMFFRLANQGKYYLNDPALVTEEVISACPAGVDLVYWDYYNEKAIYDAMLDAHAKFGGDVWFAGGAWTWQGFAANNQWTIESMFPAMCSCKEHGVENIMITMWGDNGKECSFYSVLPSLYALRRAYDGVTDMKEIKREFAALVGESYDDMMLLDLPVDLGPRKRGDGTPHKYMLYSDPFLGHFDSAVVGNRKAAYEAFADQLEMAASKSRFGYLFASHAALCRVLALKYDLGVRTRATYRAGDKNALQAVIADYDKTAAAIEEFVSAFRNLWYTENKPNGFEVHEIRLGGLLLRVRACRKRLAQYVSGEIPEIPELFEEILPCALPGYRAEDGAPRYNSWRGSASTSIL